MTELPRIRQVVLDCEDLRGLANFYRDLFGMTYPKGHETPEEGEDWLNLRGADGFDLAFQKVDKLVVSTWPDPVVPQQLHLDASVPDGESLQKQRDRVLSLGGRVLYDRFDDPEEPLYVFADPAGHPFCIFVSTT